MMNAWNGKTADMPESSSSVSFSLCLSVSDEIFCTFSYTKMLWMTCLDCHFASRDECWCWEWSWFHGTILYGEKY